MHIFFAGPLTNLKNPDAIKTFYERMDAVAKKLGHTTFWAYKSGTDPIKNPDVLPEDVYKRDIQALEKSDIMISYISEPSTGTGIEMEHAEEKKIPVVLVYQKGTRVSRMTRGNPAVVKQIVYKDESDALTQLEAYLATVSRSPHTQAS